MPEDKKSDAYEKFNKLMLQRLGPLGRMFWNMDVDSVFMGADDEQMKAMIERTVTHAKNH